MENMTQKQMDAFYFMIEMLHGAIIDNDLHYRQEVENVLYCLKVDVNDIVQALTEQYQQELYEYYTPIELQDPVINPEYNGPKYRNKD